MSDTLKPVNIKGIGIRVKNHNEEQVAMLVLSGLSGKPICKYDFEASFLQQNDVVTLGEHGDIRSQMSETKLLSKIYPFEEISGQLVSDLFTPLTLKLNNEYTAEVTTEGVRVGCQMFSFEQVEELYKMVQQRKQTL